MTNPLRALRSPRVRLLMLAAALGLLATFLVQSYVARTIRAISGGRLQPVVFAASSLSAGQTIQPDDLAVRNVPEAYVHLRSIPAAYLRLLPGQKAGVDVRRGQALLWTEIALDSADSLSDRLRINERAITIRVDQANGFNGMIRPGDRVDVLSTARGDGGLKGDAAVQVVLQNVLVLAVDDRMSDASLAVPGDAGAAAAASAPGKSEPPSSLTLKVDAADALRVATAEANGPLTLLLRNRSDVFTDALAGAQTASSAAPAADGSPLQKKVAGYPTILQQGRPTQSAYYPSSDKAAEELRKLSPEQLRAKALDRLRDGNDAPNPR